MRNDGRPIRLVRCDRRGRRFALPIRDGVRNIVVPGGVAPVRPFAVHQVAARQAGDLQVRGLEPQPLEAVGGPERVKPVPRRLREVPGPVAVDVADEIHREAVLVVGLPCLRVSDDGPFCRPPLRVEIALAFRRAPCLENPQRQARSPAIGKDGFRRRSHDRMKKRRVTVRSRKRHC